ncbi:hypothetical protein CL3_19940 [butyrate-producing bacterium SM4/1]|nr:hypothetical protein CLS_29260 [[Clostridium] cf. saccharolyticum K10]CBL36390.1 hypothetical protein CL3_19940 [butyrate-producing bacterium SM4/1]
MPGLTKQNRIQKKRKEEERQWKITE